MGGLVLQLCIEVPPINFPPQKSGLKDVTAVPPCFPGGKYWASEATDSEEPPRFIDGRVYGCHTQAFVILSDPKFEHPQPFNRQAGTSMAWVK